METWNWKLKIETCALKLQTCNSETESLILKNATWNLDIDEKRTLEIVNWKLKLGNWKLGIGNWKYLRANIESWELKIEDT